MRTDANTRKQSTHIAENLARASDSEMSPICAKSDFFTEDKCASTQQQGFGIAEGRGYHWL